VRDSGIGIDSDRLEMMFVAFQQADSSISRRYGGTGLGLSIARTLAERMGGTCVAKAEEGRARCSPWRCRWPSPTPRGPAWARRGRCAGRQWRAVLLVEDNPVNQTVIEAMLRSLGFEVSLAMDGAQAVDLPQQQRFAADPDGLPPAADRRLRSHPADPPAARAPGCRSSP
jgi:hypothetical protein